MPFPFTFISNVPGIINPFSTNVGALPQPRRSHIDRPPPSPSPSPTPTPLCRKRGWQPSLAEPSRSTTTLTSTTGYLDTPSSQGLVMGSALSGTSNPHLPSNDQYDEDSPPLKKRRGLAGTIISTAVNAALIGGAVGLTVYRLWRDRGKSQQEQCENILSDPDPDPDHLLPPPPPYEFPPHSEKKPDQRAIPTTPRSGKKPRPTRQPKRPVACARRKKGHHHHHHSTSSLSDPGFSTGLELEIDPHRGQDEVEDKMDWIGDKLSMLIEQGKKALNAQVVVMSDAKEDEVDDGSGMWEEEEVVHSRSRSGSVRHAKRPKALNPGPGLTSTYAHTLAHPYPSGSIASLSSPRGPSTFPSSISAPAISATSATTTTHPYSSFGPDSGEHNHTTRLLPTSHSTTSLQNVNAEDPASFESPELRESMERARARMMARRGGT